MNKKGFTLIELLAVIVILSLLALITSTAITKLVKDSKQDLSDIQMKSIESAAKAWGADNINRLPEVGSCAYITLGDLKEYGLLSSSVIDLKSSNELSNDLAVKIYTTANSSGNPIINYEVNPESVSGCDSVVTCRAINGDINTIGSEIVCSDEHFYITSVDTTNNTITMMTSKPIELTSNSPKQVTTGSGTGTKFASSIYWNNSYEPFGDSTNPYVYSNNVANLVYPYINAYKDYLISKRVNVIDARLISYDEIADLTCSGCARPRFLYQSSNYYYWTGSCRPNQLDSMWLLNTSGSFNGASGYSIYTSSEGRVRPVVTIPISDTRL